MASFRHHLLLTCFWAFFSYQRVKRRDFGEEC